MKNVLISEINTISDSQLSLFKYLKKIDHKKLRSIGRLKLLPYYYFYNILHKSIRRSFFLVLNKYVVQSNFFAKNYLPGHLISKRMFYKNVKFLVETSKQNNHYLWYSKSYKNMFNSSKFFNKINQYPILGGHNMITGKLTFFEENEFIQNSLFDKNIYLNNKNHFNFFIFFNMSLFQINELYKINIYLFYNILNK